MVNHIVFLAKLHKAELNKQKNIHSIIEKDAWLMPAPFAYKDVNDIAYLNCNIYYYLTYIKKKIDLYNTKNEFKMTFDNCVIDYIKPMGAFNLGEPENFLDLTSYTNTQPIFLSSKNYIWEEEDDDYWEKNIKNKEYLDLYFPNKEIINLYI